MQGYFGFTKFDSLHPRHGDESVAGVKSGIRSAFGQFPCQSILAVNKVTPMYSQEVQDMTKLSTYAPARPRSVLKTDARVRTYEGGAGFSYDAKTELFLLAVSNMVGEDTFYEKAKSRDDRFIRLIHQVVKTDADWVRRFVPFLRNTMQMRSASIVMAVEYVIAGGEHGRQVIADAIQRADEPGEVIGYYRSRVGRGLPQPIKRGISDALQRIGSSRNVIRYKERGGYSIKDVLRIAHAKPRDQEQALLYQWVVSDGESNGTTMTQNYKTLMSLPLEERRPIVEQSPQVLQDAGMTWESVAGWLQGPMTAEVWEALIPEMGYMALLRNLRNFEQAGISDAAKAKVIARLSSREEVARSRQFPFRFYSAYKNVESFDYLPALQTAMDHTVENVPEFSGKTLVLIDDSGSMGGGYYSRKGTMTYAEQAALFGIAIAKKNAGRVNVYPFAEVVRPEVTKLNRPLLKILESIPNRGGGTYTNKAIQQTYSDHDRIIVLTDGQTWDNDALIKNITVPIYTFNVAGYDRSDRVSGSDNRYTFGGGLTDAAFRMVPLLEAGKSQDWPF